MSAGNNLDRLTYRSSKQATSFAWRTIILSIAFGSAVFIILPLTAHKLEKEEKTLIVSKAPARVKIKIPEKEKIFEKKNIIKNNKVKKKQEKPLPPKVPKPPAIAVNLELNPIQSEVNFKLNNAVRPQLHFKVEKIVAIQKPVDKPQKVIPLTPVNTPPAKNYNAVFSKNDVDTNAQALNKVKPVYPRRAHRRNISGSIIINCIISKEGKITNPEIAKATPKGYFESACLDILEKIRYKPATVDGKPVAQRMELTFDFGLSK